MHAPQQPGLTGLIVFGAARRVPSARKITMQGLLATLRSSLAWLALATAAGLGTSASAAARPATRPAPSATAAAQPTCTWARPGHNPFMGDVVAAVGRYQDIPAPVRARLQARMASRAYDEVVRIRRDSILGQRTYQAQITDMHFGSGQVCASVDRSGWSAQAEERGLVYCEASHCILVPTVCRNVSRIQAARAGAGAAPGPATAAGPAQAGADPIGDSAALPLSQVAATDPSALDALPATGLTGQAWPAGAGVGPVLAGDSGAWLPARDGPVLDGPVLDGPILSRPPLAVAPSLSPLGPLPATPVPEPSAAWLLLGGLLVLAPGQWRRRRRAAVNPA